MKTIGRSGARSGDHTQPWNASCGPAGSVGSAGPRARAPRSRHPPSTAHRTWCGGRSPRRHRTVCGLQISPISADSPAGSMPRSCWTCSPAGLRREPWDLVPGDGDAGVMRCGESPSNRVGGGLARTRPPVHPHTTQGFSRPQRKAQGPGHRRQSQPAQTAPTARTRPGEPPTSAASRVPPAHRGARMRTRARDTDSLGTGTTAGAC
jgi:hypothetical protein